jgi:hypothetical protein
LSSRWRGFSVKTIRLHRKAARGGSIRTILYVSGALMTIVLIATTTVAAVQLPLQG